MSHTTILDSMYGSFLDKPIEPVKVNDLKSLTIAKNEDCAFSLAEADMPFSGVDFTPCNGDQGIVRVKLGYSHVARMESDFWYGIQILALLKNAMIAELAKNFDITKYKVHFALPGRPGKYFSDSLSSASVEIRAYITTKV